MRMIILGAATLALAACGGSVREQALSQCQEQAERMAGQLEAAGVDMDEYCECVTEGIGDGSSVSEANEAIMDRTQQCVSDMISTQMGG